MLRANWIHTSFVERWLQEMSIGDTLNVCCGKSFVGDIRIDTDPNSNRTEEGDLFNLPFSPLSFDTVICDPPFSYYNRFRWILKLADIARERFLLSSPNISVRLSRRNWRRTLYYSEGNAAKGHSRGTLFLRMYWCFDRKNHRLDEEVSE